jgi:hypothetical protein
MAKSNPKETIQDVHKQDYPMRHPEAVGDLHDFFAARCKNWVKWVLAEKLRYRRASAEAERRHFGLFKAG